MSFRVKKWCLGSVCSGFTCRAAVKLANRREDSATLCSAPEIQGSEFRVSRPWDKVQVLHFGTLWKSGIKTWEDNERRGLFLNSELGIQTRGSTIASREGLESKDSGPVYRERDVKFTSPFFREYTCFGIRAQTLRFTHLHCEGTTWTSTAFLKTGHTACKSVGFMEISIALMRLQFCV